MSKFISCTSGIINLNYVRRIYISDHCKERGWYEVSMDDEKGHLGKIIFKNTEIFNANWEKILNFIESDKKVLRLSFLKETEKKGEK